MSESINDFAINRNQAIQRSVHIIFHVMREYIPRACEDEAMEVLFKMFDQHHFELTDHGQREQYEQMKKLTLEMSNLETILPKETK